MNCPECSGPQMARHPAGVLAIKHVDPCSLRDAEDATQAADCERLAAIGLRFVREPTTAELTLLAALGPVPTVLYAVVTQPTGGAAIRRRDFTTRRP